MHRVWAWCRYHLILHGGYRLRYLRGLIDYALSEYQLFSHVIRHLWDKVRLHHHPPLLLIVVFVMLLIHHLLSVHLLLLWCLLVKRHLILGRASYKGGVAMMMLMIYAGAAQLSLLVLTPRTYLVVQRSGRLRFKLDARHVPYHDEISWVGRFSLEEHRRLTGG